MRQLADLALMLRDHETALSTLRLLATDVRADKAYRHYAAAQEAVAVATLLGGGPPADAIASLKEAFYRYAQASPPGPACSTPPGGAEECTGAAQRCARAM
jgi:hypothetical protein